MALAMSDFGNRRRSAPSSASRSALTNGFVRFYRQPHVARLPRTCASMRYMAPMRSKVLVVSGWQSSVGNNVSPERNDRAFLASVKVGVRDLRPSLQILDRRRLRHFATVLG